MAGLAIYTSGFGQFDPAYHRGLAMLAAVVAVVLLHPTVSLVAMKSRPAVMLCWLADAALVGLFSLGVYELITIAEALWTGLYDFTLFDLLSALCAVLVVLELTRRAIGLPLTAFGIAALFYVLLGPDLPWIFNHAGFTLEQVMQGMWYSLDGVFGLPMAISVNIVLIYIVFGAVLEGSGAGAILL